jgi:hypothetical protein
MGVVGEPVERRACEERLANSSGHSTVRPRRREGHLVRKFVDALRRLADALEQGQPFTIQTANERFTVPVGRGDERRARARRGWGGARAAAQVDAGALSDAVTTS